MKGGRKTIQNLTQNPLVSVVIPVFNGGNYMREAIDSALSQTYKQIEIIVVNDGSSDEGETERIALSYGNKIKYISKPNGGVSTALNAGIAAMKGDYFSWLSHDDMYTPDKIEKEVNALRQISTENVLIYCGISYIDEKTEPLDITAKNTAIPIDRLNNWQCILKTLLCNGTLNGCALLIPKTVFDTCGGFNENLRFCQDSMMWFKIFLSGYSLFRISDACVKNRVHSKQFTQTGQALFRKECNASSDYLVESLAQVSSKDNNYLYMYIHSYAKHLSAAKMKYAVASARKKGLITFFQQVKVLPLFLYGRVRPFLRKVYYWFLLKK